VEAAKSARDERNREVADGVHEEGFDEVWVVFDTEGPQNVKRLRAAKNAIEQCRSLAFF